MKDGWKAGICGTARGAAIVLALAAVSARAADPIVRPALSYSKTFGGSGTDVPMAVATDAAGNVYVSGYTNSADFPVLNGFQLRMGGTPLRATADGGKSWSAPQIAPGVNTIAGSKMQPTVLYAGTGSGIYKSVDSGNAWTLLASAPKASTGAIVVDSSNPQTVYAATEQGIIRSADGGTTWNGLTAGLPNGVVYAPNLFPHPTRPATLFASLNYTLYRSVDAGQTWDRLDGFPVGAISLAFDTANPNVVYAAAWSLGVYRSLDSGDTWDRMTDLPVTFSRSAIASTAGSLCVATSNGVLRSTDGGVVWTATSIASPADVVAVDPDDPRKVYAAADQVYSSADGGVSWSPLLAAPAHTVATIGIAASALFIGSVLPQNIFVTKWSADGKQMLYSTYLGGGYYEYAMAIAVDPQGNVYVTGLTASADFPVTGGALKTKLTGTYNAFVAKISADGTKLLYSTLLGGSGHDSSNAVAIDGAGNAYVTGYTDSGDFPVAQGALQSKLLQGCVGPSTQGDAFVAKIAASGGALLFSTYLGGTCADQGMGIAVDAGGSVYVAGVTSSPDFPVTANALRATYAGVVNSGFLAKLTANGDGLVYATFLGTGWGDVAQAVTVDDKGNAYVTGSSFGLEQPGPAYGSAAYSVAGFPGHLGTGGPAFLLKLDAKGEKVYATTLGECMTTGTSVAVDSAGRAWIAGTTGMAPKSTESFQNNCIWPTVATVHPFQALRLGFGFVAEFSADGNTVLFSSLADWVNSMSLDAAGNAVAAGWAEDADLTRWMPLALLLKIDGSVPSPVTLEEPRSQAATPHDSGGFFYPAVVAPGAVVVLPGTGLGPAQQANSQVTAGGTLETTLAGTRVTFDGIPAPLISVQAGQVVCMAPFGLAGRTAATVQVESGGSVSNAIRVPVTPTAVAILAVVNQNGTANSQDRPAAPGSVITLYVAGLGPTDPPTADGMINGAGSAAPKASVTVQINWWLSGDILYYGPAPGQPAGIAQINFRIPDSIPGVGAWPARQYSLVVGTAAPSTGDSDIAQLSIR